MTRVFDGPDSLIPALADLVRTLAQRAVAARGRYVMALSGGNSPVPLYSAIAKDKSFPWTQTHVFLVDERLVPAGDKDHNGTMIQKAFGHNDQGNIPPLLRSHHLHLIDTSLGSASRCAEQYDRNLANYFDSELPCFDFILLGMGADGHTASLFPGTGAVEVVDKFALAVQPITAPHERISLSLPVINNARTVAFLITGAEKSEPFQSVTEDAGSPFPAARVKPTNGTLYFFVDRAAAQRTKFA